MRRTTNESNDTLGRIELLSNCPMEALTKIVSSGRFVIAASAELHKSRGRNNRCPFRITPSAQTQHKKFVFSNS
jgi:hypothetical protein